MDNIKDKITGRVKQAAGDLADHQGLKNEGELEERKGEAKEELVNKQAEAERKADEVDRLESRT